MKPILDPCCGSRMFWFNPKNQLCLFGDMRDEQHTLCDGRVLEIRPDVRLDFRKLPFPAGSFHLVVFDPPHLIHAGRKSWLALKYGRLSKDWRQDIRQGFEECFRVLKPYGTLVFKWDEDQVKLADVLKLAPCSPLFGNRRPNNTGAHWLVFMKE